MKVKGGELGWWLWSGSVYEFHVLVWANVIIYLLLGALAYSCVAVRCDPPVPTHTPTSLPPIICLLSVVS